MVSILDEIIQKIKDSTFTVPFKDVREPYSTKQPVYPMITVEEVTNTPQQQINGKIIRSNLHYRFEIYGRDVSVNETLMKKREVVTTLGNELDTIMRETYGMKMIGTYQILPYASDNSILRYIVTYGGIIDNETMIIYQL
jgi:hypothetical protein|nr:MAG TPA: hypothetical protein [Caudoviricetes sp.]